MAAQMMIYLVEGREIVGSDWDYINDSQYEECQKAITIRDLRQQAKGVRGYLSSLGGNDPVKMYKSQVQKDAEIYANQLNNQADELEQGE